MGPSQGVGWRHAKRLRFPHDAVGDGGHATGRAFLWICCGRTYGLENLKSQSSLRTAAEFAENNRGKPKDAPRFSLFFSGHYEFWGPQQRLFDLAVGEAADGISRQVGVLHGPSVSRFD